MKSQSSSLPTAAPRRLRAGLALARAALLGATLLLAGCLTKETDEDLLALPETPAGVLYNQALALMNNGKLRDAVTAFDEVDRQHPYTDYARKAILMSAFASFQRGDFDTAAAGTKRYLALYPSSEEAAYAQYILGESYFRQIPDVTRDQVATREAMAAMQEILNRWPDSEYADDARNKIIVVRDQLAGKEMQVGRYYLERREYVASVNRFKVVVTEYQDTRHVEEALERLTEAYYAMGLLSEAQTAAAILGHNFPDSQWYKDAYALLQTGGHETREDAGSWISRAFRRNG